VQRELTERLKLALDAVGTVNGASTGSDSAAGSGAVVPAQARALPEDAPERPATDASASGSPADPPAQ
jgi:hypothetical protein